MSYPKLIQGMMRIALVFLLLAGCSAHAAKPKPGAAFTGTIAMKTAGSAAITFKISRDGRMIESLGISFTDIKCEGFSAGSSSSMVSLQYPILDGKITITSSGIGEISGRFTSPTKADGSIHVLMSAGMGSEIECGTWNWSATGN